MRLELTARHLDITPALRRLVDRKLGKLERLLNDSAVSAQAVLTLEKRRRRADITLHARGEKFLHGVGSSASWEASINTAVEKIAQQAQRVKGKWQARKRGGRATATETAEAPVRVEAPAVRPRMPRIFNASRQSLKVMSVAEAAREIEVSADGVVVFRDAETASISVLVRKTGGDLTLIETEV